MNSDNNVRLDAASPPEPMMDHAPSHDATAPDTTSKPAARRRVSLVRVLIWTLLIAGIIGGVRWFQGELSSYDRETAAFVDRLNTPTQPRSYTLPGDDEFWERLSTIIPEGEAAFTEAQTTAWAGELIPMVESITGRAFFERPIIRHADRPTLSASLNRDAAMQSTLLFTYSPKQVQEMLGGQALSAALLGKYGVADRVLYLAPRNFEAILDMAGTDAALLEPLAKLVLAHELTHALQDQHVALGDLMKRAAADPDRTYCLGAVIEGHAMIVQDEVGVRLGLDEAARELSWLLSAGELTSFDHPVADMLSDLTRARFRQTYIGGRDFMRHHLEAGGHDRLWTILASPPERALVIDQPALYDSTDPSIDFRSVLNGLESHFADDRRRWVNQTVTLGSILLQSFFDSIDPTLASGVMPKIREAHTFSLADAADRNVMATVTVFVLEDETVGPALVRRLHEAGVANLNRVKDAEGVTIDEIRSREMDSEAVGPGVVLEYRYATMGMTPIQFRVHRFSRGAVMAEIMGAGIDMPDERIIDIVRKLFDRCDELVNPATAPD